MALAALLVTTVVFVACSDGAGPTAPEAPAVASSPETSAVGASTGSITTHAAKERIPICHRTRDVSDPYVLLKVDQCNFDGGLACGRGGGRGDHYGNDEHAGPVFDPSIHLRDSDEWGDILPPLPNIHGGKNWNEAGRRIYNNGCIVTGLPG